MEAKHQDHLLTKVDSRQENWFEGKELGAKSEILSVFPNTKQLKIRIPTPEVYISVQKLYLSPSLSENHIFPTFVTRCLSTPIVLFLPEFFPILHLFYPFTSPFLFFFPLSSFLFPLLLFFYIPPFLLHFSFFFPQMTSADCSSPGGGGGVSQNVDPCPTLY